MRIMSSPTEKQIGVNRAVLGRFGHFRPPTSRPACLKKETNLRDNQYLVAAVSLSVSQCLCVWGDIMRI
jgi:hypothetical protein